jgi:hypothetical protein
MQMIHWLSTDSPHMGRSTMSCITCCVIRFFGKNQCQIMPLRFFRAVKHRA